MKNGFVSGSIPAEALIEMLKAIATIRTYLPFLTPLSPDQRQGMLKLGSGSLHFVQKVRDIVSSNLDLVPKAMNPEEFLSDVALVEALDRLRPELLALVEGMDDTRMAAGSDAMTSSIQIYGVLGKAKRTVPGLDEIVRDLGIRFRRSSRAVTPTAVADASTPQA